MPASGVPYVPRTVAPQVLSITLVPVLVSMGFGVAIDLAARYGCDATVSGLGSGSGVASRNPNPNQVRLRRHVAACADTYVPGPPHCTYQRHRAACPRGATHGTFAVRVPASDTPCVPPTVAPQ